MFTGIIEAMGKVAGLSLSGGAAKLEIEAAGFWDDVNVGDSISVDGVCLTIKSKQGFKSVFDVSGETLSRSTLGKYKPQTMVNLEKALKPTDRMGGHFVQGHVDGIGNYLGMENIGENVEMKFEIPRELSKYVVEKGSISINGISLTAYDIKDGRMKIAVIPHTVEVTNLSELAPGSPVNIECDIIAKYTEKLLLSTGGKGISADFLEEKGFI